MEMSDLVVFENDKLLRREYITDETFNDFDVAVNEFEWLYNNIVEFSDDLTVEGFMNALYPYFDKIDSHFVSWGRSFKLIRFYDFMNLFPWKENDNDPISHIELSHSGQLNKWYDDITKKHFSSFEINSSYYGVAKDPIAHSYSMSMTTIDDFKHYKLKLNKKFKCFGDIMKGEKMLFITEKSWSLFEVISCFLFELTYGGYPEDRKGIISLVEDRVNKIKEGEEPNPNKDVF